MATIVTRQGKGTPLTNAELDANFTNLNADKLEAGALSPYLLSATAASTYQTIAGMSSYLTTSSAASTYLSQANAASTYQTQSGMSSYLTTASASSTYLPLAGGTLAGSLAFNGTGLRITGDFTNATRASRVMFQTSTANSNTFLSLIPNGTGTGSGLDVHLSSTDPDNTAFGRFAVTATSVNVRSGVSGTGTQLPLTFLIGSSEHGRLSTAGNWLFGSTTDDATNKLQVTGSATVSGNLGLGTTNTSGIRLAVDSGSTNLMANFNSSNANGGYVRFQSSGTSIADIGTGAQIVSGSATDFGINVRPSGSLIFGTSNTERARIDSSGRLMVGTSSATSRLVSNGDTIFALDASVLGEAYNLSSSARGSVYEVSGTVARVTSAYNAINTAALINFNAYNSANGATGVFLGAVAGGSENGPANLVFGRRTGTTAWAETARIDSSGNLLVGTTSASFSSGGGINVKNATGGVVRIIGGSNTGFDLQQDSGANTYIWNRDSGYMAFATANTERARITPSGELLVGRTSSSGLGQLQSDGGADLASGSGSVYLARNSGGTVCITGTSSYAKATINAASLGNNAMLSLSTPDGTYNPRVIISHVTSTSSQYVNFDSSYSTGTGQANWVFASGNLLVGSTSAGYSATNRGLIEINGSSSALLALRVGGVNKGYLYTQGTDMIAWAETGAFSLGTAAAQPIGFITNNIERARIDSTGNLIIGGTSNNYGGKLTVDGDVIVRGNRVIGITGTGVAAGTFAFRNSVGVQKSAIGSYYNIADEGNIEFINGTTTNAVLTSSGTFLVGASSSTSRGGAFTSTLFYRPSGTQYIDIQTGTSGNSGLLFSSGSASSYGLVNYDNSANVMQFYTNSSERARIGSSGGMSIGTTTAAPSGGGLRVNGATNPVGGIVNTNIIAGFVATNYTGTRYWLLHKMQTGAGIEQSAFNCMGDVHASSYTTWNLSNLWIRREYASVNVYGGITGVIKSAVTVSIVDITYSNVRYVAIKFAGGDPGIEANLVGYLMDQMYSNGTDASFIYGTTGVTENAVIASY